MKIELPEHELMHSGHAGCPGCGAAVASGIRAGLDVRGETEITVCTPKDIW